VANLAWRIYYGDGTAYDNRDGDAYAAPARDVQIVCVADRDNGWTLRDNVDFYWYVPDADTWHGGDLFGLFDYLIMPGAKRVLFGRTITTQEFRAIHRRACDEWNKTAAYSNERQP